MTTFKRSAENSKMLPCPHSTCSCHDDVRINNELVFLPQLVTLKRQKNELERRVLEQEEELDEQAGTIQQLEQVLPVRTYV